MYCIFCYGEFFDKGLTPGELDALRKNRLKICQTFYKTVQRLLGVQPKCVLGKDTLESSCNNCLHIINNYCKLAFQTRCLQLRLNWETEQLLSVMKKANSNAFKNQRFQENFIVPDDIDTISKFRNDIMKKGAQELLKYAEPIVSLDKMMVDMANKNLPASNNCHDIIANSDRVSDKENTQTDDPAPLKILSITSLTTTTAVKEEPKNEIANLQENRKEAILAMNSIDFNDTDTVKELGNGDGGIMEQGNAEIIHMNSSADGAYDSEENSSDLLQSTDENEENTDFPQSHSDWDLEPEIPVIAVLGSQESLNIDMDNYEAEEINSRGGLSEEEFIYLTNGAEQCDTEHDVADNAFICHISGCGKSFTDENSYQRHYILHEGRHEMVYCPTCGKGLMNENYLRQHMQIHNSDYPALVRRDWACEKCNTHYSTKFNLRRHFINQHPSDPLPQHAVPNSMKKGSKVGIPRRSQDRVIGFGSLQRIFKKRDQTFGKRIRWRNPGYRCGVCEKLCENSYKLNEHMRTHSGERPFGCAFCTWRFATKSNLKRHARLVHKISEMEMGELRMENGGDGTGERPM